MFNFIEHTLFSIKLLQFLIECSDLYHLPVTFFLTIANNEVLQNEKLIITYHIIIIHTARSIKSEAPRYPFVHPLCPKHVLFLPMALYSRSGLVVLSQGIGRGLSSTPTQQPPLPVE